MRILHLDEQRGWRGGEQQAGYLIRGLAQRGHAVYLAGRPGAPFVTRDHGARPAGVHTYRFAGEWDLLTAAALARLVRAEAIDIIHAHTSHTHTMAGLARRIAGRGRVVVSRRVDFPPSTNPWSRWKYAWPDRIIAISNRIAAVLSESGVPAHKITTVHSAVDPGRFDVAPLARAALGVPANSFLLGNVAALVGHKDHATLLHAMAQVVRAIPAAHLVIAGEGPLRPDLERQCRSLGLTDHVHLLGFRDDVPQILRAVDLFVMSSKEEGLGTSVLDAMACGLPVVATAGGGIPEMVRHETTGLLARVGDPADLAGAVIRLHHDRHLAGRLAEAGHRLVHEHFAVDRMVAGNLAVYQQVLEERDFTSKPASR
jgi:L-malate glycosyltransferase